MEKDRIKRFNENSELNISDVRSSFEGMRLLRKDEIKRGNKKQMFNLKQILI